VFTWTQVASLELVPNTTAHHFAGSGRPLGARCSLYGPGPARSTRSPCRPRCRRHEQSLLATGSFMA